MNRTAIALLAALLALPTLAADPAGKGAAQTPAGKPRAPASATARIGDGMATVTVRFDSPASDVTLAVSGLDGLTVTSDPTPLTGGRFRRGQTVTFDVGFTPGPGRSHLALTIGGTFGGQQRNVSQTFAIGSPTAEQQKPAVPPVTDSQGQRIKVMPSGK